MSLLNEQLKLSHRLEGLVNAMSDDIEEILSGALDEVKRRILELAAKAEQTESVIRRKTYLEKLRSEIERVQREIWADIGKKIQDEAVELAEAAPAIAEAVLEKGAGIKISLGVPRLDKKEIVAWFESSQVDGLFFNEWLSKLEQNSVDRIIREARRSMVLREPYSEAGKRIEQALEVSRRSARGLARNAVFQAYNWGEHEFYMEIEERLQGLRFVAELDRGTCALCAELDGQVFPPEEAPVPPLHWLCRCRLAPVFNWEDPDNPYGERPARMETEPRTIHHRDGTTSTAYSEYDAELVPAKMTYSGWMQSMIESEDAEDVAFAREALGPKRFDLVESGKLKMESLYYGGKLRTIEELEELI